MKFKVGNAIRQHSGDKSKIVEERGEVILLQWRPDYQICVYRASESPPWVGCSTLERFFDKDRQSWWNWIDKSSKMAVLLTLGELRDVDTDSL